MGHQKFDEKLAVDHKVVILVPEEMGPEIEQNCNQFIHHPECRICEEELDPQRRGPLSLCQCKGTMEHLHASCLEKWLKTSNAKCCEFCKQMYSFELERPSWFDYIKNGLCSTPRHVAMVIVPLLFILFFVFNALLIGLSIWSPATVFISHKKDLNVPYMCALLVILFFLFGICCFKTVRLHLHLWRRWRDNNPKRVFIINTTLQKTPTLLWTPPPITGSTVVAGGDKF